MDDEGWDGEIVTGDAVTRSVIYTGLSIKCRVVYIKW